MEPICTSAEDGEYDTRARSDGQTIRVYDIAYTWAISSGGERLLHTQEVTGSKPVSPTTLSFNSTHVFVLPQHGRDYRHCNGHNATLLSKG